VINKGKIKILTVARLSPEKGHLIALNAIKELIRNKKLNLEYHIGSNGVMKKTVQTITLDKWVEERKIPKKVDFIKIDIEGTERL